MAIADDNVKVEWVILADGTQISGNKLYLLGGGWDVLTVNSEFPVKQHLAIAAAFRVPWSQTSVKHSVEIQILNEDTQETLASIAGEFEVGRAPGLPPGSSQLSQLAAEMTVEFPSPGLYALRTKVDVQEQASNIVPFRVVEGPVLALRKRRG